MINYTAWLRLFQQQMLPKTYYPSSGKRITLFIKLRSYCNNNTKTKAQFEKEINQKFTEQVIEKKLQECRQNKNIELPQKSNPAPPPSKPELGKQKKIVNMRYGYSIFLAGICGTVLWAVYELGKPEEDQLGRSIEDDLSLLPLPQQYVQRMWHSLHYYQRMLEEPLPTRLLPDILHPPYVQPRYTLVLEMKDVLVHPDWTYQTGWRFKKRPGVDHFLRQCSKHFEIVVYTAEQGTTAFPILDALDPNGYIRYRLVRGATQIVDGQQIKNLNRLNRNLRRVIAIDWDRRAIPLHPDNIFAIARWLGNDDDVQLFDLAAFLGLIAEHKMEDVREVLHYYRQFEDPIEQFKENQRKLLEMKQEKTDAEVSCP